MPTVATRPFITSDAKVAGAATANGINRETTKPYKGQLAATVPGRRLEFHIANLPPTWYQDYLAHRLWVDPYEMVAEQEHYLRLIEMHKERARR
jgi:hypothetical protein